jgi:NitT/TauT family transport system ATP-binding protein
MALYPVAIHYVVMVLIENGRNRGEALAGNNADAGSNGSPVLHIRNVSKSFHFNNVSRTTSSGAAGTSLILEHKVLDDIDLKIQEGEFVTIVGASGCGKSTLLNIVAGLDRPDSGSVLVRGSGNISSTKRIMIFQEGALFPWLSVRENVEFGLKITRVPQEQRRKIADKYIELVGLTRFAESFVHQLSGGMKQRVAIARALALEPEVLLMDEPFAALDVQTRDLLYEELVGIHKTTRKTILFVTHNISEAILLGDRVIVLSPVLKNIRKTFRIDLPRPRDPETPELYEIKRQILAELEGDLQNARRAE